MKPIRNLAFATLCFFFASTAHAQPNRPTMTVHDEPLLGERGLTRVLYWNELRDSPLGAVSIDFGRPNWNSQLDNPARFDALTKGNVWRLGNDYWTTLDSNVPMKISGRDIPIGLWYLGLHRSPDGATWSLAFVDPIKARSSRLDPHAMNLAPVEFRVPLTVEQTSGFAEKLTIVLAADKSNIKNVTLRITWGKLQLMAPAQILLEN